MQIDRISVQIKINEKNWRVRNSDVLMRQFFCFYEKSVKFTNSY